MRTGGVTQGNRPKRWRRGGRWTGIRKLKKKVKRERVLFVASYHSDAVVKIAIDGRRESIPVALKYYYLKEMGMCVMPWK